MSTNLKDLSKYIKPTVAVIRRYAVIIFIAVLVLIYGFLVLRINQFSSAEPSEDAITEKLQGIQRPKIDQTVVTKIQSLEDQNVQVQTLFKQARDNPFSE